MLPESGHQRGLAFQITGRFEHALGLAQQHLPGARHLYTVRLPIEQADAEAALQRLDAAGERRLGDVHVGGGFTKTAVPGERTGVLELS
jgi:hypothetical protein